ncbi:MAG: co-chaperone GroES [Rickettsiaceae bacterium H1]|nr:co-chaperone GroES [Rickettsiaceae bacterium H1]
MTKKLKVLSDTVLIGLTEDSNTSGGIMLPDSAKQKPTEGTVMEVGPGRRDSNGKLIPMELKKGDSVMYRKWAGTEVKFDDKDYVVMKESDVVGIIESE